MAVVRQLRSPPIIEALIDLQYAVPDETTVEALDNVASALRRNGDTLKTLHERTVALGTDEDTGLGTIKSDNKRLDGFIIRSQHETQVVQLRRTSVTVSQVSRYRGWDTLEALARSVHEAFCLVAHPTVVTRVATRYINRIQLPGGHIDLDDYFTCGPRVPEGAPQTVAAFEHRTQLIDETTMTMAVVVLASENESSVTASFLLDIEAFKTASHAPEFDALLATLGNVREVKNRTFFGSLQDRALEAYL